MKYPKLLLLFILPLLFPYVAISADLAEWPSDYLSEDMRRTQLTSMLTSLIASFEIYFSGKGIFSEMPDVTQDTKEFVQHIARDHGITSDLQVKLSDGYGAGIGTILVPKYRNSQVYSDIDNALYHYQYANDKEELIAAQNDLCEQIGALDHEFTHYKNHDHRNSLIITGLTNIALFVAYFTYEYKFLSEKLRKTSSFKKWLYTFSSSLGLNATTALLNCWFKRLQEKRADEGIGNESHILTAMISRFKRTQEDIKLHLHASNSWISNKFAHLLAKYPICYLLLDPIHPPLPDRVARLEERLSALESSGL